MNGEWVESIEQFRGWQLRSGIAPSTVHSRGKVLHRLASRAPAGPWDLGDGDLTAMQTGPGWSALTQRAARAALAAFYRWGQLNGHDFPQSLEHRTKINAARAARSGVGCDERWSVPVNQWVDWLRAGGLPKTTLDLRTYQLTRFSRELTGHGPWDLTADDLAGWLSAQTWARETLRSYRSALRSFYGWAHAAGMIPTDPARLLRKVPAVRAQPRPASEVAVEKAMGAADPRQYLAIMLGAHAGMRRAEISRVHTRDLLRDPCGWSLLVHGKGDKERVVPLLDEVAQAIRETPAGWLFPNGHGGHVTPAHLGKVLRSVLSPDGITPHQLRHRFASRAYQETHDIRAVQELLGHASVATTQVYTAVGGDSLRSVVLAAGRRGA